MNNAAITTLASLTLCAGCASGPKVVKNVGTLGVEVERIMPMAESLDASAVEVTLLLRNPTASPISVASVEYSLDTGDVAGVLTGTAESGATIESGQESELKFRRSIPFPDEIEAYKAAIERDTIAVKLAGKVKLGDGEVAFARQGEVATPSLPRFVVHEAQAARYGKDGVDVTLFLRLVNDNIFAVLVGGVKYVVEINGKEVKSEEGAIGLRLLGGSAEEYEVGSVLDPESYGADEVKAIAREGLVKYRVHGTLDLKRMTIPFDHEGEIELATGE